MKTNRRQFVKLASGLLVLVAMLCTGGSAPSLKVSGTARVGTLSRPSGGAAPTYLVEENFEGTGAPSGWTSFGGNGVNWDDTATSPGPLQGAQSVQFDIDEAAVSPALGSLTEVWFYYQYSIGSVTGNGGIGYGESSGSGSTFFIGTSFGSKLRIQCGTVIVDSTDSISANTKTHLWGHYVKGAGASDDTFEVWFSTDGTKPSDGSGAHVKTTVGDSDLNINKIYFGDVYNGDEVGLIDRALIDDAAIGSNP